MKKYLESSSFLLLFIIVLFCSCRQNNVAADEEAAVNQRVPVTVTHVSYDTLEEFVSLNATSMYLQQGFVKSNLNGYVQKANINFGDHVNRGQVLYVLKTKEAAAIGNSVNELDPAFKFSGINVIKADVSGYVSQVNRQTGDYVQDGEQLAVIDDAKSFVFVMNVPYEYKQYVSVGSYVELTLPDNERLRAMVSSSLPVMDSVSQTQAVSLKVEQHSSIPANLVARVKIIKTAKANVTSLDKAAVLSNESLDEFWVMKMTDDSTAVKVAVKTGIQTSEKIEIVSPQFSPQDKILLTGNYGLADTALVAVQH